jgi:hypothetical protein
LSVGGKDKIRGKKWVIRSKVTHHYRQADGRWSSRLEEANSFVSTLKQTHKLTNVEIVLMIHEQPTPWDIVLPLRPRLLPNDACGGWKTRERAAVGADGQPPARRAGIEIPRRKLDRKLAY